MKYLKYLWILAQIISTLEQAKLENEVPLTIKGIRIRGGSWTLNGTMTKD